MNYEELQKIVNEALPGYVKEIDVRFLELETATIFAEQIQDIGIKTDFLIFMERHPEYENFEDLIESYFSNREL